MYGKFKLEWKQLFCAVHAPSVLARTKHVFTVFGLTWSIFIKSLKVLVFSGVERKMPENVYNGLSHMCLV